MLYLEKAKLIKLNDTKKYLEYIKGTLLKDSKVVDYTYYIPFDYDDNLLKRMCEKEGINMEYASSYYNEGKYNPYMPLDKLVFTRRKVK